MTRDERVAVGHRIRDLRERQGWNRDELARRLGVHAGTIARWETGGAAPHGYTVRRIAQLAGTTPEWLQTGHDGSRPRASEMEKHREADDPFVSDTAVAGFLSGIAPPGEESLRKLDALDGLRRMLTARGALPGWWYSMRQRVEAGAL